jgi:hypothetical protein
MAHKFFILFLLSALLFTCSEKPKGELIFVEANTGKGFHYPYFLFIPDGISPEKKSVLIVESNNSGFADDDLQKHIDKASRTASKDFYLGNYVAQELKYPLLVPVFPRPQTNWQIYTHALDRDVMLQKNSELERIDLQLLEMVNDAKKKLASSGYPMQNQFLMTGFSASGTFANRFTLIHPDKLLAVATGGVNGLLALPLDSLKNKALNYPLGTNDFKVLFNQDFRQDDFLNTPQFYFMGGVDENDAVPYDDAFNEHERELIFELLGEQILPQRWEKCETIYKKKGVNATIKTYGNIGHEQHESVKIDVVVFFQKHINKQ